MKVFRKLTVGIASALAILAIAGLLLFTNGKLYPTMLTAASIVLKPDGRFSEIGMVASPDYSMEKNWVSLPWRFDEADLIPESFPVSINDGNAPVDVFYISPTGYLKNKSWTSPMLDGTATEENARFGVANEASIFNDCCNIYAPRYREASIFAYISLSVEERDEVLDAVYTDISDAFDYFIEHYNQNRPIVIVSHSQGTHHAIRLLREIDSNPIVANRVVVAYTVGSTMVSLSQPFIDSLNNFSTCQDRRDVSCIAHWDTYGRNGTEKVFKSPEQSICVNPLSWKADGELADARMHSGAVSISGAFTTKLYGDDKSRNVVFENMNPPATAYTWAQCVDGFLYVADQQGTEYEKLGAVPDKSYHGIDFPLFHVNIRENVKDRIEAFFENGRL